MAGEQLASIGGRRLRITNLDKVLYPETGTTKGEVIDYYTRVGPTMIPHVIGRPVTRKRWPDGVGTAQHPGQSFFAKDLEPGAPSWVHRLPIPHSGGPKDYPLVGDVPTLVYLAQVASLELHVPQWRFTASGERGDADRLVLDLDPGRGRAWPNARRWPAGRGRSSGTWAWTPSPSPAAARASSSTRRCRPGRPASRPPLWPTSWRARSRPIIPTSSSAR